MKLYIVTYDIVDDKRRTGVFEFLKRYGTHLQYSVFQCELSQKQLSELVSAAGELINSAEDQILLFDLGPTSGRSQEAVLSIGLPYTDPERHVIVV